MMTSRILYLTAALLLLGTCLVDVDASRVAATRSVFPQQAERAHSTSSADQVLDLVKATAQNSCTGIQSSRTDSAKGHTWTCPHAFMI